MSGQDEMETAPQRPTALQGSVAVLVSSLGRQLIRLGIVVLLARLLTPEEFGLVAILSSICAIGVAFQDLGLSSATVQRATISALAIGTLFWINSGVGAILTAVLFAMASRLAAFYGQPALEPLCQALSLTFLLNGAAQQSRALLRREMRFMSEAKIDLASAIVGGLCALGLAVSGFGYWALVAQVLVMDALCLILLLGTIRPPTHAPAITPEVRELLRFGGSVFAFLVISAVASNLTVIVMGAVAGPAETGLYTRAFALATITHAFMTAAASRVAFSRLSHLQNEPAEFARFYYRAAQSLMLATLPIALAFGAFGDPISRLVYGEQWGRTGTLLRIFAVGTAVLPLSFLLGQVLMARGESRLLMRWTVAATCVLGVSTLIGLRWGIEGVAWAWSIATAIQVLSALWLTLRRSSVTGRGTFDAVRGPVYAALVSLPLAVWIAGLETTFPPWLMLAAGLLMTGLVYAGLAYGVFGQRELLDGLIGRMVQRLRR